MFVALVLAININGSGRDFDESVGWDGGDNDGGGDDDGKSEKRWKWERRCGGGKLNCVRKKRNTIVDLVALVFEVFVIVNADNFMIDTGNIM